MKLQKENKSIPRSGNSAKLDTTRSYMRNIGRRPRLTHEQEIELGKQVQQMVSLLAIKETLTKKLRREPKKAEWAVHSGITECEIDK